MTLEHLFSGLVFSEVLDNHWTSDRTLVPQHLPVGGYDSMRGVGGWGACTAITPLSFTSDINRRTLFDRGVCLPAAMLKDIQKDHHFKQNANTQKRSTALDLFTMLKNTDMSIRDLLD